ncbi:MAG: hypothetical protein QOF51_2255 [Chloroflexota bacterium]|jgi:hypothetical protein|nr:hypothetical protein [Chloroflexota bacterium]
MTWTSPSDEATIELGYELTAEDVVRFNEIQWSRSPVNRGEHYRWYAILALISVPATIAASVAFDFHAAWQWLVFYGIAVILGIAYVNTRAPRRTRDGLRRALAGSANRGLLGHQFMTIAPDGLRVTSDVQESRIRWLGIDRVLATDDLIVLYTSAVSGHLIPTRAFVTPEARRTFVEAAERYWAASHAEA